MSELRVNSNNEDIILILVGNKIDLAECREVSKIEAEQFATLHDMIYIENVQFVSNQ